MIQTDNIQELQQQVQQWKDSGKTIAFVPTMGNLHLGHLLLVEEAKKQADITIASIFLNPIQFDKQADLAAYPKTLDDDLRQLKERQCDLVFTPSIDSMYGTEGRASTQIEVLGIGEILDGASRPGHFMGVATIVAKLFNLTSADIAIFGEKDFQQLMIIKQMVEDLNFKTRIIGYPTVREEDGLAMSSRNGYLTAEERKIAPWLQKTLKEIQQKLETGSTDSDCDYGAIISTAKKQLLEKGFKPDYIEIRRQKDLQKAKKGDKEIVILATAWLGKARLIDNIPFNIA
jgi:pantoate--beta-alanine ligase